MTLECNGYTITIGDDTKEAKCILEGYDYCIKDGQLHIMGMGKEITNKWQAMAKLKAAQSVPEMRDVLIETISKLL